jgi:predicted Zn finger-like uncharacterized protein
VIVTCERCETEFQLDDARVPDIGARVRCSRCKHAFVVMPPAAAGAEAPAESGLELFDRAAESAIAAAETPDITQDLPDEGSQDRFGEVSRDRDESPAESDESDWQFNADLPADPDERAPEPPRTPERRRAPEPPPAAQPAAEDLGSPTEWDFDDVTAAPMPAAEAAPPRAQVQRQLYVRAIDEDRVETFEGPSSPIVQRAVSGVGWLATAALFALALWHGLFPVPAARTAWPAPALGVALEEVRGRWLENLYVGRLYVVSGRLRNESPSAFVALPALELELRDESGRALGRGFPLAAPLAADRLREADIAELSSSAAGIGSQLRGGETREFEIVAWPLPIEAERFAIRAAAPRS